MTRFGGTDYELYQSYAGPATVTTPTAAAVSMIAGMGPLIIPGNGMGAGGTKCSSWKLRLHGLATATATVPTWQFGIAKTTTNAAAFTGGFTTATFTPAVVTGALWWMDVDFTFRTLGQTNTSVVVVSGLMTGPNLLPPTPSASTAATLPAAGGANTWTDWDIGQAEYYLWPFLTLGAATAGNTVTVQWAKLYGEN